MFLAVISIVIGLAVLVAGAEGLVRGASSIAARFHISPLVIGLTVVAFGTSAPELAVNLISAINNEPELAIGNIIGSNIANILLILGISSLIVPLTVKASTVYKEIPFALLAVFLVFVMSNDVFINGSGANSLSRIDGIVLLSLLGVFMYYVYGLVKSEKSKQKELTDAGNETQNYALATSIFFTLGGLVALMLGGRMLVSGAVSIATSFGLSEAFIGLTIVAIGTSLPELATSVVAATKKQADIAIGNIVGSNIFNVFFVLGTTSTILPLPVATKLNSDIIVAIIATFLLFVFIYIGKKHKLTKIEGSLLLVGYVIYVISLVARA